MDHKMREAGQEKINQLDRQVVLPNPILEDPWIDDHAQARVWYGTAKESRVVGSAFKRNGLAGDAKKLGKAQESEIRLALRAKVRNSQLHTYSSFAG
jgi:hypothetical protein